MKSFTGENWTPTSNYDSWIVRFETCRYENSFVPMAGVDYRVTIVLSVNNPDFDNELVERYILSGAKTAWTAPEGFKAITFPGDTDANGKLDISDVTELLDVLSTWPTDREITEDYVDYEIYNVDGADKFLTISDVTALLDLLSNTQS